MQRKLVYYVACTVDGFIAREDGSFDWALSHGEHFADLIERFPETFPSHFRAAFGVPQNARRFDTVLMGRKTYEVGLHEGITSPYEPLRQFVVSRSMPEDADSAVHLYRGAALELVRQLKSEEGMDIWLCGGAKLAAAVFTEIDELMLKINPVLIGSGIPLFDGVADTRPTTVVEHKVYTNGFVLARYVLSQQTCATNLGVTDRGAVTASSSNECTIPTRRPSPLSIGRRCGHDSVAGNLVESCCATQHWNVEEEYGASPSCSGSLCVGCRPPRGVGAE